MWESLQTHGPDPAHHPQQQASLYPLLLTSVPFHSSLSSAGNWGNQDLKVRRRLDWGFVLSNWQRHELCLINKRMSILRNRIYMFSNLLKLHVHVCDAYGFNFYISHTNHTKLWVSLWQFHIFTSYTLITFNTHYLLSFLFHLLTPLLLLNRHLSQVIPLSPLLTRSILDSLMPQNDEDFTRTVDLNALTSLKSPIQTYSHMPVSRWLRQGDGDFDANLGYKVIPLFKR